MNPGRKINIAVLVSGNGSNLQAIIDATEQGDIDGKVSVVISDNPKAHAVERARRHRIDHAIIERENFNTRDKFEEGILKALKPHDVDLICLAGFMRILGKTFMSAYPNRIINIHPALLPAFPGLESQRQAFDYGVKIAGCSVHFVDEKIDHGPIICQAAVPVREDDTPETLRERILEEEHRIYPQAIQLFAEGRLRIEERRVCIAPKTVVRDERGGNR